MADIVKLHNNINGANSSGGFMFFGLRFIIFFGLSFFILSLPLNQRPLFYYLHQGTSKIILTITGTNYYQPTFKIESDRLDKAKTQMAAPIKSSYKEFKAQLSEEN